MWGGGYEDIVWLVPHHPRRKVEVLRLQVTFGFHLQWCEHSVRLCLPGHERRARSLALQYLG